MLARWGSGEATRTQSVKEVDVTTTRLVQGRGTTAHPPNDSYIEMVVVSCAVEASKVPSTRVVKGKASCGYAKQV